MKKRFSRIISLMLMVTILLVPFAESVGAISQEPLVETWEEVPAVTEEPEPPSPLTPRVVLPVKYDVSRPMREMVPVPPVKEVEMREIPFLPLPKAQRSTAPPTSDPAIVQDWLGPNAMPAPLANFDGVDNQTTLSPPDTEGDIGYDPNTGTKYYFQWVNVWYGIWDVTDPLSPTKVYPAGPGFANGNTPWIGFGGYCESTNDGDPIALFDPLANRWFMSQFALPNYPSGPFYVCIAVSQTADPTGSWYRYAYEWEDEFGGDVMNDYPKFGVWPDAYYMTVNQFYGSSPNCSGSWCGAGVAAFERDQMLLGNSAQMVSFDLAGVNINFGGQLPADLDGLNSPPLGSPGYFLQWDDATWLGDPSDSVRVWEFDVNWTTPASSTFGISGQPNLVIPTSDVNPNAWNVPQPGTGQTLDVIPDRLMYRAAYRNFGSYEALVTNRTNSSGGVAAPYWFELRRSGGGPWTLYQEGEYAPGDGDHRWMGSIAQDHMGNMALGYSVSSGSTYPSVRYTGRLVGDPLGTMPQGEVELVAGGGSQTGSIRWGDYSMMGIDPVDDCTFWYTQEYYPADSSTHWYTRIGAFKFPSCWIGSTGVLSGTIADGSTANPIVGATIQAAGLVPAHTSSTTSGAGGVYSMILPTDTYTVTASAYGYTPDEISGVDIFSGTTTILDIALNPAAMYVVEGVVSDTLTGWPLYASIQVVPEGFPGTTIWNDPVTGYYSVTLPGGITHTFTVNAWVDGYNPASRQVAPLTGDQVEDFGLSADLMICAAPGYEESGATEFLSEDFETWPLPAGWNIVNNGGDCVWQAGSTDGDSNNTGGTGDYADADSDACGSGTSMDTELQTPILDLTGHPDPILEFQSDMRWYSGDQWDVDMSLDGGSTWPTNLLHRDSANYRGPETITLTLTGAGGQSNVRLRFRYQGNYDYWWQVDDVSVNLGTSSCVPQAGGLVVGNVYDDNFGDPLNGAEVSNEDGYVALSQSMPDDPAVEDGFYTLFSPPGSKTFTATLANYAPDTHSVTVVQSDTVGLEDFYLPAGLLDYSPGSLEDTVELGISSTLPLTLANLGSAPVYFEFAEGDRGVAPLGPARYVEVTIPGTEVTHGPDARVAKRKFTYRPEINFTVKESAPLQDGIEVLLLTPDTDTSLISTTLAAFGDLNVTKWPGGADPTGGDLVPYDVVIVGNDVLWSSGGMTQAGVGDALADYIDLGGKVIDTLFVHDYLRWELQGRYITEGYAPFTQSSADMTAIPYSLGTVYDPAHPIMDGVTAISDNPTIGISYQNVGLAAGATRLADWNDGEIFVAYNDNVVGINQLWYQGSNWSGNVPELMHNAILYSALADVDWLTEDPISGTLSIAGQLVVSVTLDANAPSVTQPGTYMAILNLNNDTPYGQPGIPVTMTVLALPDWGVLEGTVSGLGHCDADPGVLEGSDVLVEGSSGLTRTLTTDASGYYGPLWLDEAQSPYTVTVTHPDHETGVEYPVTITGQMTTTVDLNLRWLEPCVSVQAPPLEATLDVGVSTTLPLSITNTGAAPLDFEFLEQGGDIPWLYEDPISGTLSADTGFIVADVILDAAYVPQPGIYYATLDLDSNDPVNGSIGFPVTMTVTPPPTWGNLWGTITSMGYCDSDLGVLAGADVLIEGSSGMTWTVTTDISGTYSYWLDEAESPLTVTVTYPDHELGLATGVTIVAQMTTTQDFDLRWLVPCVDIQAPPLEATLDWGMTTTLPMTITNYGGGDLDFELREKEEGRVPLALTAVNILLMLDDIADWTPYRNALTAAGVTWTEWNLDTLAFPTAGDLAPYDSLIWGDEGTLAPGDTDCQVVADWLQSGDKSLFATSVDFLWDLENGTPGVGEHNLYLLFNTTYLGDYAGTGISTLAGVPGDPVGGGLTLALAGNGDSNGDYADETIGAPSGFLYGAGDVGSGRSALTHYEGPNYKTVWLGVNFHNGLTTQSERDQLMASIVDFLMGVADVPWLSEDPITGTLAADGGQVVVDVTFDSGQVSVPAMNYYATLSVRSNDPIYANIGLPVTMTVNAPANWGKLEGTVTSLGYCDADPAPLVGADVLVETSTGMSWTLTTTPDGYYTVWMTDTESPITVSVAPLEHEMGVAYPVTITAQATTTVDFDLRWLVPCVDVTPASFSDVLNRGMSTTLPMTITNWGAGDLDFTLADTDDGMVPLAPLADAPWLSEDPVTGTVSADGGQVVVDVTLDTGPVPLPAMHYYATLDVSSNDPVSGYIGLPVTLTVNSPSDWGKLEGTVTSLGHCDVNPVPLDGVDVLVESSTGMSWTLTTTPDGYYTVWMTDTESPVTVTVAPPEHESDLATGVTITAQTTTTVDFDLRWLVPCVDVAPPSMEAILSLGTSEVQTLTIYNDGAASSNFALRERVGTPVSATVLIADSTPDFAPRERLAGYDPNATTTDGVLAAGGTQPLNLLAAGDVLAQWPSGLMLPWGAGFSLDEEMVWLSDPGAAGGDDNNHEFDTNGTPTGRTVSAAFGGDWGGDIAYNPNTDTFWQVNVGGDNCIYEWDPASGATGATICGAGTWSATSQRGVAYDPDTDTYFVGGWNDDMVYHIDNTGVVLATWAYAGGISGLAYNWVDGLLFVMENSTTDTITVVDVNTWTVINSFTVMGFGSFAGAGLAIDVNGNLWAANQTDLNAYLIDSGVPANLGSSDVPWLSEDPITGTVSADGFFDVAITFTALPTMTDGIYTATLIVNADDPVIGRYELPMTLTVIAAPLCGFESSSPDELDQTTYFTNTTLGGQPMSYTWSFGDGTISAAINPTHVYTQANSYTVTLTADNPYGQDVCSDVVTVYQVDYLIYLPAVMRNY